MVPCSSNHFGFQLTEVRTEGELKVFFRPEGRVVVVFWYDAMMFMFTFLQGVKLLMALIPKLSELPMLQKVLVATPLSFVVTILEIMSVVFEYEVETDKPRIHFPVGFSM